MFSKKRNANLAALNGNNSYLQELSRAILEKQLDTKIYLVQTRIMAEAEQPTSDYTKRQRPYAHHEKVVTVEVLFTSLDHPRRHGREGIFPVIPKAMFSFVMTNEAAGWENWQALCVVGEFWDYYAPTPAGKFTFEFWEGAPQREFQDELAKLAQELEHRRPAANN